MAHTANQQDIIFVTGKGGVGKSIVAASIALKQSRMGKKTLLVELGHQSFFQDFFHLPTVTYQGIPLKPNLDVALWSGQDCLKEYALHLLKIPSLYRLFFENAVTKSLINIAPGLPELSILGKITSHPRKAGPPLNYDCLVVDAYATGHFLALLKAPKGMAQAIRIGPMGEQSREIERVISDPKICQYFVVSIPEELPVQEALELAKESQKLTGITPIHLFNKTLPEISQAPTEDAKLEQFEKYILKNLNEQKKLELDLGAINRLPFVFSTKSWDIVEKICEALP